MLVHDKGKLRLQMEWRSLISWPWKRERLLDYLGGSVQSEGSLHVEAEQPVSEGCDRRRTQPSTAGFQVGERGPWVKEWKGFYPEPTEIAMTRKTPLYWPGGKCIYTWILRRISGSSQTPWWMQRHPWPPGLQWKGICLSPILSWNTWCWILPSTGTLEAKCGTGWSVWDRGLKIKVCWGPTLSQASS